MVTPPSTDPLPADTASWHEHMLQGVSRTFALTIPQLPGTLRTAVSNAYLTCRIIDTIEDDPELPLADKERFAHFFIQCLNQQADPATFGRELAPRLYAQTPRAERDLIHETPQLIRIHNALPENFTQPIHRCARIMSEGMMRMQKPHKHLGLKDLTELNRYCYYVAGVVGEMLSELYAAHNPMFKDFGETFMHQAVAFGQGLQMTNILKDIRDDQTRNACWLPRDIFEKHGYALDDIHTRPPDAAYEAALDELIGIAHAHLRHALDYTLRIPVEETGIRHFCLWALSMAVLTLRKIHANRRYTNSQEVKISRRAVKSSIAFCKLNVRNNRALRTSFTLIARKLPITETKLPIPR